MPTEHTERHRRMRPTDNTDFHGCEDRQLGARASSPAARPCPHIHTSHEDTKTRKFAFQPHRLSSVFSACSVGCVLWAGSHPWAHLLLLTFYLLTSLMPTDHTDFHGCGDRHRGRGDAPPRPANRPPPAWPRLRRQPRRGSAPEHPQGQAGKTASRLSRLSSPVEVIDSLENSIPSTTSIVPQSSIANRAGLVPAP